LGSIAYKWIFDVDVMLYKTKGPATAARTGWLGSAGARETCNVAAGNLCGFVTGTWEGGCDAVQDLFWYDIVLDMAG
jgi:hypothetical protein